MNKFNLSVVIPTINSAKSIESNVFKLLRFLESNDKINEFEIIISAQTSIDKTFKVVKSLESEKVKSIFIKKCGKGIGLTYGFKKANFDWVLMVDDDLPYPFESMNRLFEEVEKYDVIIASRYVQEVKHNVPFIRKIASSVYINVVKSILSIPQKDIQAGMKLIKKEIFDASFYPNEVGYVWDTEMLFLANKKNYKVIEVPVKCVYEPNQLVVYKVAIPMLMGVIRVWWRYNVSKKI